MDELGYVPMDWPGFKSWPIFYATAYPVCDR